MWNQLQPLAPLGIDDSTKKKQGPEALIEAFRGPVRPPDGLGEIHNLSDAEARAIRACGYKARGGRYGRVWYCPPLPDELVWNTEFAHLSDLVSRSFGYRPWEWHPKRAEFRPIAPIDPLSKEENRIIRLLQNAPDHRLTRRDLQHYLSRKISTTILDHMLDRLTAIDRIAKDHVGWIYPCGRAELESIRRRERERRLTPTYSD